MINDVDRYEGLELEVWHIPQITMKPFIVKIENVKDGFQICEILAKYDLFQLENNIKPDYANANGVHFKYPPLTGEEFWSIENVEEWDEFLEEIDHSYRNLSD